jgi:fermentation-respiration switch protein FrsA (DUF1100 family)
MYKGTPIILVSSFILTGEKISMHPMIKSAIGILLTLLFVVVWFSQYERQAVEIINQEKSLYGSLVLPNQAGHEPLPVVIFIHGDGPSSSGSYGYYHPLWQALANEGIASLSWDKQGVGGSQGHWLDQNMDQRADEISVAIDWIEEQPHLDQERIGVIGFSQAGWVLPKALVNDARLKYAIMVSTAVNWLQQGRYQTVKRLTSLGHEDEQLQESLGYNTALDNLLNEQVSYQKYKQFVASREPKSYDGGVMNKPRYEFVVNNMNVDATDELSGIEQPVLALFGDSDDVVDVQNSIRHYEETISGVLRVKVYKDADHGLFKNEYFSDVRNDSIWFGIKMNWLGADAMADNFIEDVTEFVKTHSQLKIDEVALNEN